MEYSSIEITKIINPHLFWVFERDKSSVRLSLEQELSKLSPPLKIGNPVVGQQVLVKDQVWKRAVVKVVTPPKIVLWLIDYGIVHEAENVYSLPERFVNGLPLIKRAALKDVVGVQQTLSAVSIELTETVKFNPGAIKCFQEHTKNAITIFFRTAYEKYGSYVGEINIIGPNGNLYDVANALVADKILAINPDLFDTALQENIKIEGSCESFKMTSPSNKVINFDEFSLLSGGVGRGAPRKSKKENSALPVGKMNSKENLEYIRKWTAEQALLKHTCDNEFENDTTEDNNTSLNDLNLSGLTSDSASLNESGLDNLKIFSKIRKSSQDKSKLLEKLTNSRRDADLNNISSDRSFNCSISEAASASSSTNESKVSQEAVDELGNSSSLNKTPEKACPAELVKPKHFSNERKSTELLKSLNMVPAGHGVVAPKKVAHRQSRISNDARINKSKASSRTSSSSLQENSANQQTNSVCRSVTSPSMHCQNNQILKNMGGCKCENCQGWVNSPVFYKTDQTFIDVEQKQKKICVKPRLLLKTNSDTEETIIEMKTFSSIVSGKSKVEIASTPKILIHGRYFPSPVTSIPSVPFHKSIHQALTSYKQPFTTQSYAWPTIMRRLDICLVNQQQSGKTTAYLPCVCSFLLEKDERYALLPKNVLGPIVIILCPGIKVAEDVYNMTAKLFMFTKDKPVYALAVPPLDKHCLNQFQKQCDMLITTPNTLIRLLQSKIICVKRLCHLVIENCDTVLNKFPAEIESLLKLINGMLSNRGSSYNVQMILTAEQWFLPVEELLKKLSSTPIVCIGTYLEAALYGRADIEMHLLQSNVKKSTVIGVLKETSTVCKTIILCNSGEEIDEIKEHLQINGVDSIFIYDEMENHEILELESGWLNTIGGKHLVLVCTDQVFNHTLNITNAVVLIHYSLPETWTQFANRFNCLLENYKSPLVAKKDDYVRSKVHVFVDERNNEQFPRLAQLLSRMGAKLNTKFKDCYKRVVEEKENSNVESKIKLCSNLKLFGQCTLNVQDINKLKANSKISFAAINCRRRHLLTPNLDYNSSLPKSGKIKFKIIKVQDVTTLTVKILEHTDTDGKKKIFGNFNKDDLQNVMREKRNSVFDVDVGSWYIVYSLDEEIYYRCAVKKILEKEKITKRATLVLIRLLDSGSFLKVSVADLYEIPTKFHKIPPEGVDIYLANMVPPDHDDCWSSYAKNKVENILMDSEYKNENVIGTGRILLQLEKNIWLENVILYEKLVTMDLPVCKLNLRKSLMDNNLANYCEDQLNELYKLCNDSNISLPDYTFTSEDNIRKCEEQIKPQWAFIDDSDCTEIYINCFDLPSMFYVRLKKFYDLFQDLQKEIQTAIQKPFYVKDFDVEVNKFYLAKDYQGDEYCRVQVVEIIEERLVKCFYVDYGDFSTINKWELKYLSNELIHKLPFQTIECRLYGVAPVVEEWDTTAINICENYIYEPNTDYFRTLYSTVCLKEKADTTGGDKCAVILADNFNKKIIIINQLLLDCGVAMELENEKLSSEFHIPEQIEDDDFDEAEALEDITIEQINNIKKEKTSLDDSKQNQAVESYSNGDNTSDSHTWDIEINDKEMFLKELMGISPHQNLGYTNQELPAIKASPTSSDYCTPNIVWYQTPTHIKLSIVLSSEEYVVSVIKQRVLMFRSSYDERKYQLNLQLFDKVEKTVQHSCSGSCIKVTLIKCKTGDWQRLVLSPEKMIHIKYDVSQCSLDEEKKKPFLQLNDEIDEKINDGVEVVSGSDEDSESDPESEPSW